MLKINFCRSPVALVISECFYQLPVEPSSMVQQALWFCFSSSKIHKQKNNSFLSKRLISYAIQSTESRAALLGRGGMKKLENQQVRFLEGIKSMKFLLTVWKTTSRLPMNYQGHLAHKSALRLMYNNLHASLTYIPPILWSVLDAQPDEKQRTSFNRHSQWVHAQKAGPNLQPGRNNRFEIYHHLWENKKKT